MTGQPPTTRVLLVEDNLGDVVLLRYLLVDAEIPGASGRRFDIEHADRLAAALERLGKDGVDVILLDLSLPDSQGLDTLRAIRERVPQLPVLLLTGLDDRSLALEAMQQGAQDYLVKGRIDGDMLARGIGYAIERQRLRLEVDHHMRESEESAARIRMLIERNADAIIVVDDSGTIVFANPAAGELFGYAPEALIGSMFGFPVGLGNVTDIDILRKGGDHVVAEMRVVEVEWEGIPAHLASLRDVTVQREAEEARTQLLQMKDELIGVVSHELRTPLTSIMGFLHMLRQGKVKDASIQQEFLLRMSEDADRLLNLVNDLLDTYRLETGRMQLDLEEVDMNMLTRKVLAGLHGLAEQKGVVLRDTMPQTPLIVRGDRHRLEQVLMNLVGNSIKFSEAGHPVEVAGRVTDNRATIEVIDQGPGISEEDIPKLFDRFYQVRSQAQYSKGTGLGLYIARLIIQKHGGDIGVDSTLGQGSTFFFTVPLWGR